MKASTAPASSLLWAAAAGMALSMALGPVWGEWGSFRYLHVVLAVATVAAWAFDPKRLSAPVSERAWKAFLVVSLIWVETSALTHFASFNISAVDFSIFDWMLQSTARGRLAWSPIFEVNHLGVHSSFMLLALVPLHALVPSPLWLVITGPLLVWLGLFPVRRLVRHCVGEHGGYVLAASLALVASPHLGRLVTGGFRIENSIAVGTLWFLVGWVERRPRVWVTAAAVLFLFKEDSTLYLGSFAFAVAVIDRSRRAEALGLLAVCLLWLGIYTKLVQPALAGGPPGYMTFWHEFGETPATILRGMAARPQAVLERLFSSGLWAFFAPVLFLPWLSWRAAAGMAPSAFLLGTSSYQAMHELQTYYPVPLVAFALYGVLDVARLRSSPRWRAVALLAMLLFPVFGYGYARVTRFSVTMLEDVSSVRRQIASAPRVCGQTVIFPHLGYPADLRPLFDLACADAPGTWTVVSTALDPSPLGGPELQEAIARWRLTRKVTEVGAFLIIGPE